MTNYKRLSDLEREEISRMLAQKHSFQSIAKSINRDVSTISREVKSGGSNKYIYRANVAHRRALRNSRKRKIDKRKLDDVLKLKRYLYRKLRLKWSPTQIAETLEIDYPLDMIMRLSPEAIYTYLYINAIIYAIELRERKRVRPQLVCNR